MNDKKPTVIKRSGKEESRGSLKLKKEDLGAITDRALFLGCTNQGCC